MNRGKKQSDKENALPSFTRDELRAAVEVTLQNVLLKQGPERDQQKAPTGDG